MISSRQSAHFIPQMLLLMLIRLFASFGFLPVSYNTFQVKTIQLSVVKSEFTRKYLDKNLKALFSCASFLFLFIFVPFRMVQVVSSRDKIQSFLKVIQVNSLVSFLRLPCVNHPLVNYVLNLFQIV